MGRAFRRAALQPHDDAPFAGAVHRPAMAHPRLRARTGLTLVEVVVALTLLATGLVGLAAVGAGSLQRLTLANAHDTAARLSANRLAQLTALPCGAPASGSTSGAFSEEWSLSPAGVRRSFLVRVRFSIAGRARSVSVAGAFPC